MSEEQPEKPLHAGYGDSRSGWSMGSGLPRSDRSGHRAGPGQGTTEGPEYSPRDTTRHRPQDRPGGRGGGGGGGGWDSSGHLRVSQAYEAPQPQFQQMPPPIRLVPGQPPPFFGPPILNQQYQNSPNCQYSNQHHGSSHPQQQHYHPSQHQQHQHQLAHLRQHHYRPSHHQKEQQQGHYEDSQFPVQPLDRFKVKCAPFRQPIEIGSFSYDEKRNFIMDDSQLKYYFPPDLTTPNNLSVNYEKYIARDSNVDEHIDALLDALIGIRDRELREQQEKREEESERQDQRSDTRATMTMTQADFVCYRGILTKIMCTPYTRNEPWELGATLYKGSIYIEEHVSAENRKNATGTNERHKLMSYWGYRFETICNISKPVSELRRIKIKKRRASDGTTQEEQDSKQEQDQEHVEGQEQDKRRTQENVDRGSNNKNRKLDDGTAVAQEQPLSAESKWCSNDKDAIVGSSTGDPEADDVATGSEMMEQIDFLDPELTGRLDGIVNTNLQYCTVARTKIGRNSIIMGAEVDCTSEPKKPAPHNPLSNYIELKTSRIISNAREQNNFERHKLLKFWAQSFLPGIPTIIVGFRDDDGNVVTVKTFKTMEIPRLVRGKDGAWDTTICINFLDSFLNFLRKVIVVDDPEATYTIRWAYPFRAIEVEFADKRNMFLTERFLKRWSA